MFRGIANATLDAKGRMPLPTRFREQVLSRSSGQVVLTVDIESRCLLLYCRQDWDAVQRRIEKLPNLSPTTRKLQRLLIGHATDLELDASGRFLVSPNHRDYAGLEKRLVVLGQSNKIEIWSEALWQASTEAWLNADSRRELTLSEEFGTLSI
ncbi:MAG: division/cell wall cluster transcriptional repressor MraZ [Pseudomonadota bacterium]